MNQPNDHDQLLNDVLSGTPHCSFREAVLDKTLCLVRRRRRIRRARRAALAIAALGCVAALFWRGHPSKPAISSAFVSDCPIVLTQPLAAGEVVTTRPLPSEQRVTSAASVGVVRTTRNGRKFHVIDDDELLALVGPRAAALVGLGPGREALVFANPANQKGFPID